MPKSLGPGDGNCASAPCANQYGAREAINPSAIRVTKYPSHAIRPSAKTALGWRIFISRTRYCRQFRISLGNGLLSGGAQRAVAVMYAPINRNPSPRFTEVG